MAIYRLLQGAIVAPEAASAMVAGFEATLRELKLTDRDDPITELIARLIIDCAKHGERDPIKLRNCAMEGLRPH